MKKGITIMALSTIIAVTIILTTVVIISASTIMESMNKTRFVTELLDIQDAIASYKSNNGTYPEAGIIQVDLTEETTSQFSKETQNGHKVNLYLINYQLINITSKIYGNEQNEKDVYAFSEETGIVYYIQGIKYKGKTYYTVTDEITDMSNITINLNKNEIKKLDIIFVVSDLLYTNIPVSVDVKFPNNATETSIDTTNDVPVSDISNLIGSVNKTDVKSVNYDIIVNYKINDISKQVKYEVRNFDNIAPNIDINNKKRYNIDGNIYLTGINVTDNLSGIKQIKYELENITDMDYFNTYGKILNDTKINITDGNYCTIYAIDNAGNKSIVNINLNEG